jgi:hypothetical protein
LLLPPAASALVKIAAGRAATDLAELPHPNTANHYLTSRKAARAAKAGNSGLSGTRAVLAMLVGRTSQVASPLPGQLLRPACLARRDAGRVCHRQNRGGLDLKRRPPNWAPRFP